MTAMPRMTERAGAPKLHLGIETRLLFKPVANSLYFFNNGVTCADQSATENSQFLRWGINSERKVVQFQKNGVHLLAKLCQTWFGFSKNCLCGFVLFW